MSLYIRKEKRVLAFRVMEDFGNHDDVPGWVVKLIFDGKLEKSTNKLFPGFLFTQSNGQGSIFPYGSFIVNDSEEVRAVNRFKFINDYKEVSP